MTFALRRVWLLTIPVALYSSIAYLRFQYPKIIDVPDSTLPLEAVLTFAMGMLILFRINRAYERWWEARTIWGSLVNVSRNLAIKTRQFVGPERQQVDDMRDLIINFSYALKDHLREKSIADRKFVVPDQIKHIPNFIVSQMYGEIKKWNRTDQLTAEEFWAMDREAHMFLEICGACERIKSTLMSRSWRIVTRQCIILYLLLTPWALVEEFGYWTVPVTVVGAYFIIAGEAIAHYVEEPFGVREDHLDLDGLCKKIDESVTEICNI
jgi:putative membrane protein